MLFLNINISGNLGISASNAYELNCWTDGCFIDTFEGYN